MTKKHFIALANVVRVPYAGGFGIEEVTIPGPFRSLAEIKSLNRQRRIDGKQGGEYWGRSEVRFFDSRPLRTIIHGRFVIDSRQFHGSNGYTAPREWSVCLVTDDGQVEKVAFPADDWDGNTRTMGNDGEWKEFFANPDNAKIALRLFLSGPNGGKVKAA